MKTMRTLMALAAIMWGVSVHAAPADVDASFDPGSAINGWVNQILTQPDGKIVIAGDFTTVSGAVRRNIARLNTDGTVDESFLHGLAGITNEGGIDSHVDSLALQSDGKLLICGTFTAVNGQPATNCARLNSDGILDTSFHVSVGTDAGLGPMLLLNDGKLLIGGAWHSLNGQNLVRVNSDGSTDDSFLADLVNDWQFIICLAAQEDGKIIVTGPAAFADTNAIARLNPNGSLDETFACQIAGDSSYVSSITFQPDGQILLAGRFDAVDGVSRKNLARLNPNGSLDSSFLTGLPGPDFEVGYCVLDTQARIVISGVFLTVNAAPRAYLARLNLDGTLDDSFLNGLAGPNDWVGCIHIQPGGRILAGGAFSLINGATRRFFAALEPDGTLDDAFLNFGTGPNNWIYCTLAQSDGKILIGGPFDFVNGSRGGPLARLNQDGSLDASFNPIFGIDPDWPNGPIRCLAIQPDESIFVGGQFTNVNGVAQTNLVRLRSDGSVDTGFAASTDSDMNVLLGAVVVQEDGKVLIGGNFTTVNGTAKTNLARLNADGSLDSGPLGSLPDVDDYVGAIVRQPDGKILIGGGFRYIGDQERHYLARLNSDGSVDSSFMQGQSGPDDYVGALVVQPDGKVLIGGSFSSVDGQPRANLARLNSDGSLDETFLRGMSGPDYGVLTLALQADGKILLAGWFTQLNGVPQTQLGRLKADGSVDSTFRVSFATPYEVVNDIAVQSDGKIVVVGEFTAVNQIARSYVARLMGDYAPLTISLGPQSQTAESGSAVDFRVRATGYALAYQWVFNGSLIPGCTGSVLHLAGVSASDAGQYSVVVSNATGVVTSAPAALSVVVPVNRRPVPGVSVAGQPGISVTVEYSDTLGQGENWTALQALTLNSNDWCFDISEPLPLQRFYRGVSQTEAGSRPALGLKWVPALTLTGAVGAIERVDYINAIGPTDAWITLASVTLSNTSQIYFDTSAPVQPQRLYRIVQLP